jgi:hypothetical protein
MIKKAVYPDSFDYGMPSVALIGHYSKGLDKTAMDKRASAFRQEDLEFPRKKGYRYFHIITTGGLEKWGSNANGDAFPYDQMIVRSEDGRKTHHMDGGLKKYHNKEYTSGNAAVYKEHQTKRQKVDPSGYIVKAACNDNMCRGELIIGVDEDKWRREIQKKANGGNIFFSMGCDVKSDFCNQCLNEAHTREEYCDHVKNHMGKLTKNGSKVFVYNDAPHFYDISGVACPADKIAFALKEVGQSKTASCHDNIPSVFGTSLSQKIAAAMKIAEMEKKVPVEVTDDLEDACCDEEAEDAAVKKLKQYRADEVLDALHRKGIMLGPKAFYELIASDTEDPEEITNVTDDIKIDPEQVFFEMDDEDCPFCSKLDDSSYDMEQVPDMGILGMLDQFMPMLSSDPEAVKDRTIRITIIKKASHRNTIVKEASQYVSEDYAKYATAFVARNPDKALFALTKIRKYSK